VVFHVIFFFVSLLPPSESPPLHILPAFFCFKVRVVDIVVLPGRSASAKMQIANPNRPSQNS